MLVQYINTNYKSCMEYENVYLPSFSIVEDLHHYGNQK